MALGTAKVARKRSAASCVTAQLAPLRRSSRCPPAPGPPRRRPGPGLCSGLRAGLGTPRPATGPSATIPFLHSLSPPLAAPQVKLTILTDQGNLAAGSARARVKISWRRHGTSSIPTAVIFGNVVFASAYKPSAKCAVSSLFSLSGIATCCPFP